MSRWPLLPLVPVYAAAQALDSMTYARGWRVVTRLQWPVVSVGNLSVGGAGKTPLVMALARGLSARGWQVDVLSRGYGRSGRSVEQVDPEFAGDAAARYGDEPWLISQAAQVPVFVGTDRTVAGSLAEDRVGVARGMHLLDDGFQHRRLARDVDIVVLHQSDFTTALLPAGRLREPLAALERADIVVLREADAALEEQARRWMRSDAVIVRVCRELSVPALPGPAVVFSAIAHPAEFVSQLREGGVPIAGAISWRDHHRFRAEDTERLQRMVSATRAACFVTTEKDAARLSSQQRAALEKTAPLLVARLTVRLVEENAWLDAVETRVPQRADARRPL